MDNKIIKGALTPTDNTNKVSKNNTLTGSHKESLIKTDCLFLVNNNIKTRIDYVTINLVLVCKDQFDEVMQKLKDWLKSLLIKVSQFKPKLKHFDDGQLLNSYDVVKQNCGAIKWSNNKTSIRLELTGFACELINLDDRYFFPLLQLDKFAKLDIRRIDLALDDLSGKYNIRHVQKSFSKGDYSPKSGTVPTRRDLKSNEGRTIYIGANSSHKKMVIYEKGKQLKLPADEPFYKNWTRHELRLQGKRAQPIPLDIFTAPDSYFVAAYPKAYSRMLKSVEPRAIVREVKTRCKVTLDKRLLHLRNQYGPTVMFAKQTMTETEIISSVARCSKSNQPSLPIALLQESKTVF
ncbi:replication initiation factor domain-containing protein [Pseudoalteromonas sp. SR44-5]|uniref:replication initiation factor domain-containing protein n=1 Tax=unclassified Pseudoalteromonas TaxID=194690 RepID=UPI00160319AA|nr:MULTISPECIES: replication initiation factor domain-containing protein [unclassified Pseudoalteromonas]MBB1364987.1 replication initiation factor domain-containing protein [Pseudoalteromonas sp. SR44-5]MBB1468124.1 replication initiation factor domain-containing protein [Pseudoalteromonas sp. SG41-5]